jgi:hypothetical protein
MKAEAFDRVLGDTRYRREDPKIVEEAAASLGASLPKPLLDFYKRFRGPLGSNLIGYQLLDLVEENPSVLSLTNECRTQFSFPAEWIVISDLNAGALLVLDCRSNRVYDVDFEGGIELLKEGALEPRWTSIEGFLIEFFQMDASDPDF